ncbi:MAG: glycogen/starch synthase [Planctomycetes bacterium]|nr:glycogen/starch synthase [Planctomycetota bacterium]
MPDSLHSFFSPQEIKTLHAARREIEIRDASVAYCVYENPFARSGGIFAVAENYGRELLSRGRDAVFLSPFHSRLKSQPAETEVAEVGNCRVPFGGEMIPLRLFEHLCKGVRWILFRADGYFEASGGVGGTDPYIHEDGDRLLNDSLFASAAIPRVLSALGMKENVIVHVQDWELASAALSVKQAILDGMLKSATVVLTCHNPYDCGLPLAALRLITPRKHRGDEPIETVYQYMIPLTDAPLTTVSTTFAKELTEDPLQTDFFAGHLQTVLREQGVIGVDNGLFGSAHSLSSAFAVENALPGGGDEILSLKRAKRQTMIDTLCNFTQAEDSRIIGRLHAGRNRNGREKPLRELRDEIPVFLMFGRLDPRQKGFDVLSAAIRKLPRGTAKFVLTPIVAGAPQPYVRDFVELAKRCAGDVVVYPFRMKRGYRETMAGASFVVMPSLYEPFGGATEPYLQGTPVVARSTGGLGQQVIDVRKNPAQATGILYREPIEASSNEWRELMEATVPAERMRFRFYRSLVDSLESALLRAVKIFRTEPKLYGRMLGNLHQAATAFSWQRAADEYEDVYRHAVS